MRQLAVCRIGIRLLVTCESASSLCHTERVSPSIFSDNTSMHVTLINFHLPRDVSWIKSRTSQGMSHCSIFLSNNSVPGHPPVFPPKWRLWLSPSLPKRFRFSVNCYRCAANRRGTCHTHQLDTDAGNIVASFWTQIKNTQRVASIQDTQKIFRNGMSYYTSFCGNIISWQIVGENCSV